MEPLEILLRKNEKFVWETKEQDVFLKIKEILTEVLALKAYISGYECIIRADASAVGLGAVLCQKIGGVEHTVAFASRVLSEVERKYFTIKREAPARAWLMKKFKIMCGVPIFSLAPNVW